ncbi:MAG: hypothetical protein CM15mV106_190 [uncultured marine virus]|nr:MAG: hypothetical protein CM15mV106_190 [uncultured marine virus]
MYVKIVNNAVDTFPYSMRQLRSDNANTSFPATMTDAMMADWGMYPVTVATEPSVAHNEIAEHNSAPTLVSNVWTLGWTTRSLTSDEIASKAAEVRYDRDLLLAESDWTQMPDSPLTDAKRQSGRRIERHCVMCLVKLTSQQT